MSKIIADGLLICTDCAMILANGSDGWGTDVNGNELGDVHLLKMAPVLDALEGQLVSGCNHNDEDGPVDHRDFSSARCAGCGTYDAGDRCTAVLFVWE